VSALLGYAWVQCVVFHASTSFESSPRTLHDANTWRCYASCSCCSHTWTGMKCCSVTHACILYCVLPSTSALNSFDHSVCLLVCAHAQVVINADQPMRRRRRRREASAVPKDYRPRCQDPTCEPRYKPRLATFGYLHNMRMTRCIEHKADGMIDLKEKCEDAACTEPALYGPPNTNVSSTIHTILSLDCAQSVS
jgi:hypothetical protein